MRNALTWQGNQGKYLTWQANFCVLRLRVKLSSSNRLLWPISLGLWAFTQRVTQRKTSSSERYFMNELKHPCTVIYGIASPKNSIYEDICSRDHRNLCLTSRLFQDVWKKVSRSGQIAKCKQKPKWRHRPAPQHFHKELIYWAQGLRTSLKKSACHENDFIFRN